MENKKRDFCFSSPFPPYSKVGTKQFTSDFTLSLTTRVVGFMIYYIIRVPLAGLTNKNTIMSMLFSSPSNKKRCNIGLQNTNKNTFKFVS